MSKKKHAKKAVAIKEKAEEKKRAEKLAKKHGGKKKPCKEPRACSAETVAAVVNGTDDEKFEFEGRDEFEFDRFEIDAHYKEGLKGFADSVRFYVRCIEDDGFETPLLRTDSEVLIDLAEMMGVFAFRPSPFSEFELEVAQAIKELFSASLLYLRFEAKPYERSLRNLLDMIHMARVRLDDEDYQSPLDMLFRELETGEVWDSGLHAFKPMYAPCAEHASFEHYKAFRAHSGLVRLTAQRAAENAILKIVLIMNRAK